jgi:hypothetical protein
MKQIIGSIIIVLAFFSLGYFAGTKIAALKGGQAGDNTYQAGWNAAKKRLLESGYFSANNSEINSVFGQVKEVNGNSITLKIRPLEPLADRELDERTIQIDENTKIYANTQREQKEYQQLVEEFTNKKREEAAKSGETPTFSPADYPSPFIQNEANISDIKVGVNVTVKAVDKDIKTAKNFKASEVTIVPTM